MIAAKDGHVEVVQVLLEGCADVQRTNDGDATPLQFAALNGHLEVCRLLLDWGAKVNTVGGARESNAVQWAAGNGYSSVVKLLLERGADVMLKDKHGLNTIEFARQQGRTALANWLDSLSRV
jgi:ankyrin repeat protein